MLYNVKNTRTGEILHEQIELTNIMHGAFTGDDRYIAALPDGGTMVFSPMKDHLISAYVEPETPETLTEQEVV